MGEDQAILVVERNPRNRELLEKCLGQEGYRVLQGDTLEACDKALADDSVALVLFDMAGLDLNLWSRCEWLRQRHIPFLVLSARPDRHTLEACLNHGACTVLAKPLSMHELLAAVEAVLNSSSP